MDALVCGERVYNIYYYREFIFQYFTHRWKQPEGAAFLSEGEARGQKCYPEGCFHL